MKIKNHCGRKSNEIFLKNVEAVKRVYELNPDFTQREVAQEVGLHPVTVNKIVKHLRNNQQ